jgi:hypothetical protein
MMGVIVIQKRVAYFGCTVALGGSFATLSHAGQPFFSSPASLVQPHSHPEMVGVVGWHRIPVRSNQRRIAHHCRRSR